MTEQPLVSVIIPSYRRETDLIRCVKSIRENSVRKHRIFVLTPEISQSIKTSQIIYDFLVIDDNSRENSSRKKSLWAIINLGIKHADTDWVVWLNDDCLVNRGWDKEAFSNIEDNTALLVFSAKGILSSPEYRVIYSAEGIPCANYGALRKSSGFRFDERFQWFYGDADLSMQIASSSWNIEVVDFPGIIHNHKLDHNRVENETNPATEEDRKLMDVKWRYFKSVNNRIIKMNLFEKTLQFAKVSLKKLKKKLSNDSAF